MILWCGPNRIGQGIRVRLLLRPRRLCPARARIRTIMGTRTQRRFRPTTTRATTLFRPLTHEACSHLRTGKAGRRHSAVRRPEPLNLAAGLKAAGGSNHRHATGEHRAGRRPQTLCRNARSARAPPHQADPATSEEEAVAIAGESVTRCSLGNLRSRPSRDGVGLSCRTICAVTCGRDRGQPAAAGPGRSLSRGRDRVDGIASPTARSRSWRNPGAHRGAGNPQRRQRLCDPDFFASAPDPREITSATRAMAKE